MKNARFSILIVTLYLFLFTLIGRLNGGLKLMLILFSFSPFLIMWMVYTILRYGKYSGKTLADGEEWAYEDISKDKLS